MARETSTTGAEQYFEENELIVSKTDIKGRLTCMVKPVHPRIAKRRQAILVSKAAGLMKVAIAHKNEAVDALTDVEQGLEKFSTLVDDPKIEQLRNEAAIVLLLVKQLKPDNKDWCEIVQYTSVLLSKVDAYMKTIKE